MIECEFFYDELKNNKIDFFTGVPDSLLKNICAYITDHTPQNRHVIAANEGNAVGLAMGHYLATGDPALVYMQNSGQGNAINPIASLADPDVYGIPMVLLVGWRGEPGIKDEPQHVKQGKITLELFKTLGIPTMVLPDSKKEASETLKSAAAQSLREKRPVALVVKKGVFGDYKLKNKPQSDNTLGREKAIEIIAHALPNDAIIVSTTGKPSRELYEIRDREGRGHQADFLTVGGMGHAAQIAAGIAIEKPQRMVCCLDGDGAVIMHMGGLGIIASLKLKNYKHIVLNNQAHDSVGGQPTVGSAVDFPEIASHCGYPATFIAHNEKELNELLPEFLRSEGPALLEVCVAAGSRTDLGRPKTTPAQNKEIFMEFVANDIQ
jgi:phosphonopyruvate decarboxylase